MLNRPASALMFVHAGFAWLLAATLCLASLVSSAQAAERINIGILSDGPTEGFQQMRSLFTEEIQKLAEGEFDVRFPVEYQLDGNWSAERIQEQMSALQADDNVDMVLTLGFVSSLVAVRFTDPRKPTFAPLVLFSSRVNLPREGNGSGVRNLNYLSEEVNVTQDIDDFLEVVRFSHVGLIVDRTIFEVLQDIAQQGKQDINDMGLDISFITNDTPGERIADKIPKGVNAVMVAALPRLGQEARDQLVQDLIDRKLPSYSLIGTTAVNNGLMMAMSPDSDWQRLARKMALNVQAVLLGESAGDQPVVFRNNRQLTINMETVNAIEVYPRFDVLSAAKLINADSENHDVNWSLSTVAVEALNSNLDIQASISGVNAVAELENQARAELYPQITGDVGATQIDGSNPSVANGFSAERTTSASIGLNQVIYSEQRFANVEIQEYARKAREASHRALELDVIQQATTSFLNVLRARTVLDIDRRALSLARTNLDLAENRVELGSSSAADVYRWESEVANARGRVLASRAVLDQAMDQLNRLLNRPIDERFTTEPATIADKSLMISHRDLVDIISNQRSYDLMGELFIIKGQQNSPEILELEHQIASAERSLLSNERSYWSPDVSLAGQALRTLEESPTLANSQEGENDWTVSLNLSIPIFQGGARKSRVNQSEYELHQLNLQRDATRESVELEIRNSLHAVQSSYPAIELTQISAESARKNLDLVQDNYILGNVSIISYLDALTASLDADQNATNAVYDFLINLMNLQRATAEFDFFLNQVEMERTIEQIRLYISQPNQ